MSDLRNLVHKVGVVARFEDKGNRLVIDDIENHDQTILKDLNDENHYDEVPAETLPDIIKKVEEFTKKWKEELEAFHPNVRGWINDIKESKPGKAKGLIKCHKPSDDRGRSHTVSFSQAPTHQSSLSASWCRMQLVTWCLN